MTVGATAATSYGAHTLCRRNYSAPCTALTYGIQQSYDFELQVADSMGCRVFGLDPSVSHCENLLFARSSPAAAAPAPRAPRQRASACADRTRHDPALSKLYRKLVGLGTGVGGRATEDGCGGGGEEEGRARG